jgi:phosphomannomutase
MSFDYKIAAFDLDGTIAESKQSVSIQMAEKLFELAQKIKIVVISGGSMAQFQKQILPSWLAVKSKKDFESAEIANKNLIFLPVCGTQQYFYDQVSKNWFINYAENFESSIKDKVYSAIELIIKDEKFDIPDNPTGPYIEDRGTQITFSALGQLASFIEKQNWDPDRRKKTLIRDELAKMLPELEVRVGGTTSIDILPRGFDKAVGLGKLLPHLKMTKGDMIFVGDALFPGGNDEPVAKIGVKCVKVDGPTDTLKVLDGWITELK